MVARTVAELDASSASTAMTDSQVRSRHAAAEGLAAIAHLHGLVRQTAGRLGERHVARDLVGRDSAKLSAVALKHVRSDSISSGCWGYPLERVRAVGKVAFVNHFELMSDCDGLSFLDLKLRPDDYLSETESNDGRAKQHGR